MKVIRSPRFDRTYRKLTKETRKAFREKMELLESSNFTHPSHRIKKIKGTSYIWEGSIDMKHRFTFEKIENGIKLRVIGKHSVLDRP